MLTVLRVSCLLLLCVLASAADKRRPDYHLTGANSNYYSFSPFAHGHMHGYEEGFAAGDFDYQMLRPPRMLKDARSVPKITNYQEFFGSKEKFRRGFEYGYLAGYSDGYSGQEFRDPLPYLKFSVSSPSEFDHGVQEGYGAGISQSAVSCQTRNDFCAGYNSGALLGQEDRKWSSSLVAANSSKR